MYIFSFLVGWWHFHSKSDWWFVLHARAWTDPPGLFPRFCLLDILGPSKPTMLLYSFGPENYIYIHRYKYINGMFLIINPITPYNDKVIYIYLYHPSYKC